MAYQQQINAAAEIISKFDETSYVMFLAEMQSGKTGAFLLVICEMIREGLVDYGVIFSGNREIELKEQTEKSRDKFFVTYAEYLTNKGLDLSIIETIKSEKRIKVVWGPALKKFRRSGSLGKTIYVWEESHFGQSKKQEVDKFITDLGIDPTGNSEPEGCFVLSVSATPFSEFTSNILEKHHKHIVRMYPPESYRGIKQMREDNQIRIYSDTPEVQFKKCLEINRNGYAIVRGMDKTLSKIARDNDWDVKEYIQTTRWKINEVLDVEPDRPTVIFIKDKLRMGKEINKTHLLWCMETSNNPKTDTLLQGLLGRCCGYTSRSDILIFIRDKQKIVYLKVKGSNGKPIIKEVVNSKGDTVKCTYVVKPKVLKELKRFISWHDNTQPEMAFAPRRGTNMCEGSKYLHQIPLKVEFTIEEWDELYNTAGPDDDSDVKYISDHNVLRRILKEKYDKGEINNQNEGTADVIRTIIGNTKKFKIHYPHIAAMNPNEGVKPIDKLIRAFNSGNPIKRIGESIGVSLNEFAVFPHNREKCVYITFCLPNVVGCTTRREVFSKTPLPGRIRPPVELVELHTDSVELVELHTDSVELVEYHTDWLTRLCNVQVMRMVSL